jgi:hypothetical protein
VNGTASNFRETTMTERVAPRHPLPNNPPDVTEDALRRIRGEFLEMPGLRLTEAQACRLWGLDLSMCSALLAALTDATFLFRTREGAYMRVEHARPAKAGLRPRRKGMTAA